VAFTENIYRAVHIPRTLTLRPMALATALGLLTILGVDLAPGQQNAGAPDAKKSPAAKSPAAKGLAANPAKEAEANQDTQLKTFRLSNAKAAAFVPTNLGFCSTTAALGTSTSALCRGFAMLLSGN